jgi:hypothetical protein
LVRDGYNDGLHDLDLSQLTDKLGDIMCFLIDRAVTSCARRTVYKIVRPESRTRFHSRTYCGEFVVGKETFADAGRTSEGSKRRRAHHGIYVFLHLKQARIEQARIKRTSWWCNRRLRIIKLRVDPMDFIFMNDDGVRIATYKRVKTLGVVKCR